MYFFANIGTIVMCLSNAIYLRSFNRNSHVCHMKLLLFSITCISLINRCDKTHVCFSSLSSTVSKPLLSNVTHESHDEKNMRLKRPLSPHLSIYQPQLTWVLSGTHRTTGIMLASYAMFLGLGKIYDPICQLSLSINVFNASMSPM